MDTMMSKVVKSVLMYGWSSQWT